MTYSLVQPASQARQVLQVWGPIHDSWWTVKEPWLDPRLRAVPASFQQFGNRLHWQILSRFFEIMR